MRRTARSRATSCIWRRRTACESGNSDAPFPRHPGLLRDDGGGRDGYVTAPFGASHRDRGAHRPRLGGLLVGLELALVALGERGEFVAGDAAVAVGVEQDEALAGRSGEFLERDAAVQI